jgi:hypothetical protein
MKRHDFSFITTWRAVLVAILMSAVSAFAAGPKYNVIYRFQGSPDGAVPDAPLIADQAGNLYGTTQNGGNSNNCFQGCGTVFRLKPPAKQGEAWKRTILHNFNGTDGFFARSVPADFRPGRQPVRYRRQRRLPISTTVKG